jgi:hypothetical protein
MIPPTKEADNQIRPLIICIPSQIATNATPSIKSEITMSIPPYPIL